MVVASSASLPYGAETRSEATEESLKGNRKLVNNGRS